MKAEIWEPGIQKGRIPKLPTTTIRKVKIRLAQNVQKVWISRNKKTPGPILVQFQINLSMDRNNATLVDFCLFSLAGQWALFTRFGRMLLSRRLRLPQEVALEALLWLWLLGKNHYVAPTCFSMIFEH